MAKEPTVEQIELVRQLQMTHEVLASGFAGDERHWRKEGRSENAAVAEKKYQYHSACSRALSAVLAAVHPESVSSSPTRQEP